MTLALLLTAVGGAWADETPIATILASENSTFVSGSKTFADKVKITFSGAVDWVNNRWQVVYDSTNGNEGTVTVEGVNGTNISKVVFYDEYGSHVMTTSPYTLYFYQAPELSDYIVCTGANGEGETDLSTITKIEVFGGSAPAVEVTTNEAKTEATFQMPAYDATAEYELVRDMGYGVKALVNNGAERIYVTKVEDKFVPKEAITYSVIDVMDAAYPVTLTENTDYKKLGLHILDGDQWKDVTDESDLKPGTYEMIFEGLGKYDGKVYSQEFLLSNGYELTIAAGEYATFYHNEKLRIEDTDAELYTIASVSTTEAVLSEKMEVAPAETPLLVYNAGSETKTFLLIPTDDEASEVLVAAEFRGTLAAKDMPASSSTMDYYVCTGKAFTWVRDAGQIAANRCWLQIGSGNQPANTRSSSRAITRGIGGIDGTTGIDAIDNEQFANDTYYDLQGRKVQNPKRGGIYIHNGKKVIKH